MTGMRTQLYTPQTLARDISTLRGAFEEIKPLPMREELATVL